MSMLTTPLLDHLALAGEEGKVGFLFDSGQGEIKATALLQGELVEVSAIGSLQQSFNGFNGICELDLEGFGEGVSGVCRHRKLGQEK
jgi:hypothetical protein